MTNGRTNAFLIVALFFWFPEVSLTNGVLTFQTKVMHLLRVEPENPKCFAEGMRDLTCFWEEREEERGSTADEYTFTYTYQNENSSNCDVAALALPLAGSRRLFFCQLARIQFFVPLDVHVLYKGQPLYSRNLFIENMFLLDPPANVTVTRTGKQGQLRVTWLPPPLKYMQKSMMYEVRYAPENSRMGKEITVEAKTELILQGLFSGTKYKLWVRVKPDGITYNGTWSVWSDPILMATPPSDMDPLIILLIVIISVILFLLSLTLLLSYGRFLLKKLWPDIPTPEQKFSGLFTVHGGDFQQWLGHSNSGRLWHPVCVYSEESPAPLEVLSEASLRPPPTLRPNSPKAPCGAAQAKEEGKDTREKEGVDSGSIDRWLEPPHARWLAEQLRAFQEHPAPLSQSSLLESQDAYVILNQNSQHANGEATEDEILEESLPLQALFSCGETSTESRSDLGSLRQSSGSGRLSSQSSFEYPNHTWPPLGPGYTYMAVADSGVSMDYSPMSASRLTDTGKGPIYTNNYKNEILAHRQLLTGQNFHSGC
ncbi:erythropoietin receptor [Chanos chanos]|uniref:Erythropoietin receptor n=1 Tax=Chanos chanos TaxID=29144 RepID=A0A6J2WK07_CHACN|nr:erythropoietin receptor-like [Chanos chanos]